MAERGQLLEELFDLFIEQLLDEVKAAREEGIPLQAADKAAIIRFLQINNMAYVPGNSDALAALREKMLAKQSSTGSALAAVTAATADLEDIHNLYGSMQ